MESEVFAPPLAVGFTPDPPPPVPIPASDDLDVPLPHWLVAGVLLAGAVAAALLPYRASYLGELLLDRGPTQLGSLYLACATFAFLGFKAFRVLRARAGLRKPAMRQPLPAGMDVGQARQARDALISAGTAPALRRARVLDAYLSTGTRAAAAARAEEDAFFAQTAMDQSYSLPRTLVWAIPLMGFIGTVVGISAAVAGFSGFLSQAEEIEQIKSGIGTVTTGLAVAFDTTLLALALSVLVMLVLVLMERVEGGLLLALEADVSDAVVRRLPEGGSAAQALDRDAVSAVVHEVLSARLPDPQAMVLSAEAYLRDAAEQVAGAAREAAAQVVEAGSTLRMHHEEMLARLQGAEVRMEERMAERDACAAQALAGIAAAAEQSGRATVMEVRNHAQGVAKGLADHAAAIAQSLERVGATLQQRADALERHSTQLAEVVELERSLNRTLQALETSGELRSTLAGVEGSLRGLRPALERLNQPRRIMLVEAGDAR